MHTGTSCQSPSLHLIQQAMLDAMILAVVCVTHGFIPDVRPAFEKLIELFNLVIDCRH